MLSQKDPFSLIWNGVNKRSYSDIPFEIEGDPSSASWSMELVTLLFEGIVSTTIQIEKTHDPIERDIDSKKRRWFYD